MAEARRIPQPAGLGGGDHTQHHVGVADDVFRGCLDGDVDAKLERPQIEAGTPSVIEDAHRPCGFRRGRCAPDVLDLEGQRARALEVDNAGVGTQQGSGIGQRIVVGSFDPEALQQGIAETANGTVGGIDHQQVVAGCGGRQAASW